MTQEHPVVPPYSLLQEWIGQHAIKIKGIRTLLIEAAQWGADQELERCCELIPSQLCCGTKAQRRVLVSNLQERRRPKPKKVSMIVSITGTEDEIAQLISRLKDDSQISIQFR